MKFKCPVCQSIIYSRRHKVCGSCGAILPKELLLTEAQIQAMDRERMREKKRAREFPVSPGDLSY